MRQHVRRNVRIGVSVCFYYRRGGGRYLLDIHTKHNQNLTSLNEIFGLNSAHLLIRKKNYPLSVN